MPHSEAKVLTSFIDSTPESWEEFNAAFRKADKTSSLRAALRTETGKTIYDLTQKSEVAVAEDSTRKEF